MTSSPDSKASPIMITFQAPFDVVKKLIEAYPESVRCADDQDMLPLHYAFRFGSEDKVLAYVLEEFPQAGGIPPGWWKMYIFPQAGGKSAV